MRRSAFVRQKAEEKAQEMTSAAAVYRVAIADLLKAKPDEQFHDALDRVIDERIKASRWYVRLFAGAWR